MWRYCIGPVGMALSLIKDTSQERFKWGDTEEYFVNNFSKEVRCAVRQHAPTPSVFRSVFPHLQALTRLQLCDWLHKLGSGRSQNPSVCLFAHFSASPVSRVKWKVSLHSYLISIHNASPQNYLWCTYMDLFFEDSRTSFSVIVSVRYYQLLWGCRGFFKPSAC